MILWSVSNPAFIFGQLHLAKSQSCMIWDKTTQPQQWIGRVQAVTLLWALTQDSCKCGMSKRRNWCGSIMVTKVVSVLWLGIVRHWVLAAKIARFLIEIWGINLTIQVSWSDTNKKCVAWNGPSTTNSLPPEATTTNYLCGALNASLSPSGDSRLTKQLWRLLLGLPTRKAF